MNAFDNVTRVAVEYVQGGLFTACSIDIGDAKGSRFRRIMGRTSRFEDATPVDEHTLYDMASCTKIMCTTLVTLQLVEEGVLALSDTMERFYDGLSQDAKKITVASLLCHASGIPGMRSIVGCDREHIAREILAIPPAYPLNAKNDYACLGFILLGEILEKATGRRLDQLAQERVFSPLGMRAATFRPTGANIAATRNEAPFAGVVHDYNARYLGRPVGNAGVFCDIDGAARFARMLLCGGKLDNACVLKPGTLAYAAAPHAPFTNEDRCLGFYLFRRRNNPAGELLSDRAFGHTGWTGTSVMADPARGFYMTVLTNCTHSALDFLPEIWRFRRRIHNAAAAAAQACIRPGGADESSL